MRTLVQGPPRAGRGAGRRLPRGPGRAEALGLPPRGEAGHDRRRRRRRRAARARAQARHHHRRLRLGVRRGHALRRGAHRARLPRRQGARARSPGRRSGCPTSSSRPRARARTSPCSWPTSSARQLIVAVGTHNSMEEFLDKGRAGMASTFLVRLRVGASLVDAKGVNRLYRPVVKTRDISVLVRRRPRRAARRHARQRAAAALAAQPVDLPALRVRLMINIRYHVYSLVAVFLALAIGVAAGSTVVQRSVVDNLRSTQGRIEKNLDDLEAQERRAPGSGRPRWRAVRAPSLDQGPAALPGRRAGRHPRDGPARPRARPSDALDRVRDGSEGGRRRHRLRRGAEGGPGRPRRPRRVRRRARPRRRSSSRSRTRCRRPSGSGSAS